MAELTNKVDMAEGRKRHTGSKKKKFLLIPASCFCPQVVYSSSARELKVETVKPDAPEKEEDDIDIDAI